MCPLSNYPIQLAILLCFVSLVLSQPETSKPSAGSSSSRGEGRKSIRELVDEWQEKPDLSDDDEEPIASRPARSKSPVLLSAGSSSSQSELARDKGKRPMVVLDDLDKLNDDDDDFEPRSRHLEAGSDASDALRNFGGRRSASRSNLQRREEQLLQPQSEIDLKALQGQGLVTDAATHQASIMRIHMSNLAQIERDPRIKDLTKNKRWLKTMGLLAEASTEYFLTDDVKAQFEQFLAENPFRQQTMNLINKLRGDYRFKMDECKAWETSDDTPATQPNEYERYKQNLKELFELDELSQAMLANMYEEFVNEPARRKLAESLPGFRPPAHIEEPEPLPLMRNQPGLPLGGATIFQRKDPFFDSLEDDDDESMPEWADSYKENDYLTSGDINSDFERFMQESRSQSKASDRQPSDDDKIRGAWKIQRPPAPEPGPNPENFSFPQLQPYFLPQPNRNTLPRPRSGHPSQSRLGRMHESQASPQQTLLASYSKPSTPPQSSSRSAPAAGLEAGSASSPMSKMAPIPPIPPMSSMPPMPPMPGFASSSVEPEVPSWTQQRPESLKRRVSKLPKSQPFGGFPAQNPLLSPLKPMAPKLPVAPKPEELDRMTDHVRSLSESFSKGFPPMDNREKKQD